MKPTWIAERPTYASWNAARQRCLNPKNKDYLHYGGRGITICGRWINSFRTFLADMGERPKGYTLDRKDNGGPYSPENCRWASRFEQNFNKRNVLLMTFQGVTKPMWVWADELGINRQTLRHRIFDSKWPVERALTEKVNGR